MEKEERNVEEREIKGDKELSAEEIQRPCILTFEERQGHAHTATGAGGHLAQGKVNENTQSRVVKEEHVGNKPVVLAAWSAGV